MNIIFCRCFGYSSHKHLCTFQNPVPVLGNIQENQQIGEIRPETRKSSEGVTNSDKDKELNSNVADNLISSLISPDNVIAANRMSAEKTTSPSILLQNDENVEASCSGVATLKSHKPVSLEEDLFLSGSIFVVLLYYCSIIF